ncbi:MAG: hypothetical protein KGI70_02770 [Patescibacteria group bacterium]|nr:hypothetical protein [Patescibacteria group bacterium]
MSAMKWITGIIVIAAVAAGVAWYAGWWPSSMQASPSAATQMSNPQDTTNGAIVQDTAAIDTQMQGLSQDQGSVDSSFNDQPVQQSY